MGQTQDQGFDRHWGLRQGNMGHLDIDKSVV